MSRRKQHLLSAPAVAVSFLPAFACPLCATASIGVLSALGFGYLLSRAYLLPITAGLLVVALGGFAFRAQLRHGYGPLLVGAVAGTTVLLGKFKWDSALATYAGVGLLIVSSLWNAWPRRQTADACPACNEQKI